MISELFESRAYPLFWDELRELLGPFLGPILNPVIDFLELESNRAMILETMVSLSVILIVLAYVAYEIPSLIKAFTSSSQPTPRPSSTTMRKSARRAVPTTSRPREQRKSHAEQIGDVHVHSRLKKARDTLFLTVDVENKSDHDIEMVVVDLHPPEGIDFKTGSFRMQRIGTIPPGTSKAAEFRLTQDRGSISDISGYVEFMSSSYEITKVDIPAPELEQ